MKKLFVLILMFSGCLCSNSHSRIPFMSGDESWKRLESYTDRVAALQIQEDLLKEIKINTLKNTYATVKTISSGDINKGYVEFYKKVYDCRNDIKVYAKAQILNYNNFVDNNLIDNMHIELGFKDEFEKAAYLGALGALAARWIRNDFKETPEEMAQITIRTLKIKTNDHE